ncbi:MAG: polysaccharide biosynthesis tyrosine autokinase [Thermodesulfobacteriota bacterium]|nr:polysaccharide biosynthesis tyrosine autokinase [Thermodesulfobacteriota bacterium]
MSKVYQALKKAEKESIIDKGILSLCDKEEKPMGILSTPNISSFDQHLVSLLDANSIAAEQYRKLRTRILQFSASSLKTVLITSSTSQEGKSITAANLAITIAQGVDQHVLLVDGDLRQPSIHKLFGLDTNYGLTDYLTENIDIAKVIVNSGIPKLKLLLSGSFSNKPSELIASKKMKDLIQELKSRYDDRYIIIDSTPVTATDEPDILAEQVDGIIMVVRAGKTSREVIERALSALNAENILGVVFNRVEFATKRLSYGSYYGYYPYGNKRT